MRSDKRYLRWCKRQNKGIRIVNASNNLTKAYLEKSRNALKSMEVNANAGITEWAISAAYYARYFAVYALLSRIGVRCEIHDCTIALFNYFFGSDVQADMVGQLRQSKQDRIDAQYYSKTIKVDFNDLKSQAKQFVLVMEKLINSLDAQAINALRSKLSRS